MAWLYHVTVYPMQSHFYPPKERHTHIYIYIYTCWYLGLGGPQTCYLMFAVCNSDCLPAPHHPISRPVAVRLATQLRGNLEGQGPHGVAATYPSNWRCFWKQSNMTNYFIGIYSGFIGIYSGFNGICNLVGGFNLPLWKMMEFVNWDYDIPNVWKNKIHVPNHQSAVVNPTINHPQKSHINGWQDPSPKGRFTVGFTALTTLGGGDSDKFLGKKTCKYWPGWTLTSIMKSEPKKYLLEDTSWHETSDIFRGDPNDPSHNYFAYQLIQPTRNERNMKYVIRCWVI